MLALNACSSPSSAREERRMMSDIEQVSRTEQERWLRLGFRLGRAYEISYQLRELLPPHLKLTEKERRLNRVRYGDNEGGKL